MNSEEVDFVDRWSMLQKDLLTDIFILLPGKIVNQCKLVCKRWLALASSDEFCHVHTHRYPKEPSFLLEVEPPMAMFVKFDPILKGKKLILPYTFPAPTTTIIDSCNGLMLLERGYGEITFEVYNPTTKLSRKLSLRGTNIFYNTHAVKLALAFDPSKSPHYKIVGLTPTSDLLSNDCSYVIEVYDSNSHKWELKFGPFESNKLKVYCSEGVYCNGSIYWETLDDIVSYNIARNEWKSLPRPDYYYVTTSPLQRINDRLCMSRLVKKVGDETESIELMELEADHSAWVLRHKESIQQHHCIFPSPDHTCLLGYIAGSDEEEIIIIVYHRCKKISFYTFVDKKCTLIFDIRRSPLHRGITSTQRLKLHEFITCLAVV